MRTFEANHRNFQVELDQASALPSLQSVMHDVGVLLQTHGYVGIVLVDLEPLNDVEAECGSSVYNTLIERVSGQLEDLRHNTFREGDLLCSVRPYGEQIALFLEGPRRSTAFTSHELESVADRIWEALSPRISALLRPLGAVTRFRLGYSLVMPNPMIQTERLIYRGLDEARVMSEDYSRRTHARGRERLRDLIVNRQLTTVFQPILQMGGQHVQAYEALIRGPSGTDLASPAMLFDLAAHTELVAELDRACLESAFRSLSDMPDDALLFANVMPALLNDRNFRMQLVDPRIIGIDPTRVVLELNEGAAIRSYDYLAEGIAELRRNGVRVAVDDLGAGYANLEHVLRLKPDFLKLDISLIRDVHLNPVKQAMIASMVSVGRAVEATVIAEGIEQPAERQTLMDLGVVWGQGYLFARPAPGFARPPGTSSAI